MATSYAYYPHYSTNYGENHGYNERAGSNNAVFRNRCMNPQYRTPPTRGGSLEEFAPPAGGYVYDPSKKWASQTSTLPAVSPKGSSNMGATYGAPAPAQSFGTPVGGKKSVTYAHPIRAVSAPGTMRMRPAPIKRPGLSQVMQENMAGTGKDSMCRRLQEKVRLQYHLPGYMGFVKNQQFLHGQTYGKTTRKCIMGL